MGESAIRRRRDRGWQQIADWLQELGMSEYAQRFTENEIDIAVFRDLIDQHLQDLGVFARAPVENAASDPPSSVLVAVPGGQAIPPLPERILAPVGPAHEQPRFGSCRNFAIPEVARMAGSSGPSEARVEAKPAPCLIRGKVSVRLGDVVDAPSAFSIALYAARRRALAESLLMVFGDRTAADLRPGGMHLIARFGAGVSDVKSARLAQAGGFSVEALSRHAMTYECEQGLLLGFTNIAELDALDTCRRLHHLIGKPLESQM